MFVSIRLKEKDYKCPACSCSVHAALSRTRIGQINDEERTKKYIKALKSVVTKDSVCLSVGDTFIIALAAAKLGAKKVSSVQNCCFAIVMRSFKKFILQFILADTVY